MRIDLDQAPSLPQLSFARPVGEPSLPIGLTAPNVGATSFSGFAASAAQVPSTAITVAAGDTIGKLAQDYGTTVEQLRQLNPDIRDLNDIRVGDRINVPTNRQVIEVQPGDTLQALAERYGVSTEQLQKANGIADPDAIQAGQRLVVVPPVTYGLDRDAAVKAYIDAVRGLREEWPNLSPAERLEKLGDALNTQLRAAGVPEVRVLAGGVGTANGVYDFTANAIRLDPGMLQADAISDGQLREVADTLYHEGRHAEQWHDMARVAVARGGDPADLGITSANAQAARDAPALDLDSERGRFATAMFESVYGTGAQDRNAVLSNITADNYEQYRALPEEADAWRVGGKVLNLWPRS